MDRQAAKEILVLYRPGVSQPTDSEFAEAIELTRRDRELGEWFAAHCAFQSAVRARLREVPVPVALKERIIASRTRWRKIPRWNGPWVWAAAAAMVLLFGLSRAWLAPADADDFGHFRDKMARVALRTYRMDMVTNDLNQIRGFLRTNEAQADYVLSKPLEKLPGSGCAILKWHNRPVTLICFDLGLRKQLYLFVVNRNSLPGAPPSTSPDFEQVNKLMTASWSAGGKTYVLAGVGDESMLKQYLDY